MLNSEAVAFINSELLQSICRRARFAPGDILRRKGQYYRDMYLLTEGCVEVDLGDGQNARTKLSVSNVGAPIGEIGFMRGCPATATVTARATTTALVIDDPALARLEHEQPRLAARLLRHLAQTAEERTSYNLTWSSLAAPRARSRPIEIYLCRNTEMLESAQRLRYEVYCRELG